MSNDDPISDWADEAPEEITGVEIIGIEKGGPMRKNDSTSGILVHWEVLPRRGWPGRSAVIRTACGRQISLRDAGRPGNLSTVQEGVTTCKKCLQSDLYGVEDDEQRSTVR